MLKRLLPLALATFVVSTSSLVIAGLLPAIAESLDVSMTAAGQLITVFALTYAVAAPVLGAATANWDRRTVLLLAMAVFTAGNALAAIGATYEVVLLARIVSALAAALISAIAMATASAVAPPEKRGRALAVVTAGMTIAATVGVPLGTLIGGADWRITMWAVAGLGMLAGLGIFFGLPKITLPSAPLSERLQPLRDPGILTILAVTLLILTSGYTLYSYIGTALSDATGGQASRLTAVLAAYGLGSVIGNVVSGFLTDRFRPVRVLLGGLAVLVVTLSITPLVTVNLVLTMVWATVWGVSGWLTGLPQQHRLVTRAPESAAILLGLNASVLQLGIAVGGGFGGLVLQWSSPALLSAAAAAVAGLALLITLATTRQRASAREPATAAS